MGNALYVHWDDAQRSLYDLQYGSSIAASIGFGTVVTHFCLSEWIMKGKEKDQRNSPTFIVSCLVFWAMYTLMIQFIIFGAETVYYIATPILSIFGFVLNLIFSWLWCTVSNKLSDSDDNETYGMLYTRPNLEDENVVIKPSDNDVETPAPVRNVGDEAVASALVKTQPAPRATVDYINNIKIFLTNVVILHHCFSDFGAWPGLLAMNEGWGYIVVGGLFVLINASYFMNLFFFYSGYFVPKSFDKKGRYTFLFDRVKRLGIPFVAYTYIFGPYIELGFMKLFFNTDYPKTTFNTGPTWFLNQLLLLSIIYAFACGTNWRPKIPCQSLIGFFFISLAIGLLTFVIVLFSPSMLANEFCSSCNGGTFFFAVPHFGTDFLSYPVYFFAGALAQRNNWLESIREKSRVAIYAWAIVSIALTMGVYACFDMVPDFPVIAALLLQAVIWKGILSMGLSLAITVFFMDYANKKYFCTPFFSKAMYTAYIIQNAFPVLAGLKCLFLVLESAGSIEYEDGSEPSIDTVHITNDNLVLPGWLLVSAIALVIDWPLAYAIRSIPGFAQVL